MLMQSEGHANTLTAQVGRRGVLAAAVVIYATYCDWAELCL